MKIPPPPMILLWILLIAAPFVITAIALAVIPPDTLEMPMQVGFDGHVSRMAPPSELWLLAGIMSGCNVLMALCYCANDFLWAHGLVSGVKKKSTALKMYVICAVILIVVQMSCTAFLVSLI